MAFDIFTTGGVGTVQVYAFTAPSTVGALVMEFSMMSGRAPKENTTNGLFDLELKHAQLSPEFMTWWNTASPYDPSGTSSSTTYDLDTGTTLGGTGASSNSPTYLVVAAVTEDVNTTPHGILTFASLMQCARGSADLSTAKGKPNETTSKFVGVAPTANVTIVAASFPAVIDGVDTVLSTTAPRFYDYLDKAA